jgi:hypothetical protein
MRNRGQTQKFKTIASTTLLIESIYSVSIGIRQKICMKYLSLIEVTMQLSLLSILTNNQSYMVHSRAE